MTTNQAPDSTKPSERDRVIADLQRAANEIAQAGHNGWGNTCMQAAALLEADGKAGGEAIGEFVGIPDGPNGEIQTVFIELYDQSVRVPGRKIYTRPQQAAQVAQPLTVWFDQMPESNGKRNWTVMLRRKDSEGLLGGIAYGVCFERTEYYDRARYAADRLRFLIGELDKEPDVLNYDPTILQSGEAAHGIGKDQS